MAERISISDALEILDYTSISENAVICSGREVAVFEIALCGNPAALFEALSENADNKLKIHLDPAEEVLETYTTCVFSAFWKEGTMGEIAEDLLESRLCKPHMVLAQRSYVFVSCNEEWGIEEACDRFWEVGSGEESVYRRLGGEELARIISRDLDSSSAAKALGKNAARKQFRRFSPERKMWDSATRAIESAMDFFSSGSTRQVASEILATIPADLEKEVEYVSYGWAYRGGIAVLGIPHKPFNVLGLFSKHLTSRDSISLHYLAENAWNDPSSGTGSNAFRRVFENEAETDPGEAYGYIQLVVSFESDTPQLLTSRIHEFQRALFVDFDTRRICGRMSAFLSSHCGAGKEKLQLHHGAPTSFLLSHFPKI